MHSPQSEGHLKHIAIHSSITLMVGVQKQRLNHLTQKLRNSEDNLEEW